MAVKVQTGAVLRRGTDRLTNEELKHLLDNPDAVAKITAEIEERREIYLKAKAEAEAAQAAAQEAQEGLDAEQDQLTVDQATLESDRAAMEQRKAGLDEGAQRRSRELDRREEAVDTGEADLKTRTKKLEADLEAHEADVSVIQDNIDQQQEALDERRRGLVNNEQEHAGRAARLQVFADQVNQAQAMVQGWIINDAAQEPDGSNEPAAGD